MEFFEKIYFQLNEIRPVTWFDKGSYTNHVDSHGGRGVSEMSTLLIMAKYLVKLSMKGEGGQKSPKNCPDGLSMPPMTSAFIFWTDICAIVYHI